MGPDKLFRRCIATSVSAPDWPSWDGFPVSGNEYIRQYPEYAKAWRFAQLMDERSCAEEIRSVGNVQ